ncbi:major facilitator superfamily domain-containing protein 8 isoform X2 [Eurytemora carolleeae]|uniref:major facilitator superfamily domain-containing protein 8 isoform X2 n=1 Tax=Eurytemora carolleeae TaxID=1294199 RepID=UPI000C765446|nr:major facilitator superfamily domain-containing protein 8 isoform X2 [Eurytemora carolleeae]|eukprot:XP_023339903.1 major facilitator superfamily domain-containing protein 8-like isoform X2 [Eurytemora affinis]
MGFIIGPGIQAGLVPLGAQRISGESSGIYLDMYTATGWVSASTGALCIILYLPYIFQEKYIAVKEREFIKIQERNEKLPPVKRRILREASRVSLGPTKIDTQTAEPRQLLKSYSRISVVDGGLNFNRKLEDIDDDSENGEMKAYPPIIPALTCLYNYFSFFINFVLLETILTPLAMDMWAWTAAEALQNIGLTMIGGGFLSLLVFALIGPLSKRFDERILLLVMGILPMILGRVVLFPFPGAGYPLMRVVNSTLGTTVSPVDMSLNTADFSVLSLYARSDQDFSVFSSDLTSTGCKYEWCTYIPKITVAQFLVGYALATMGYPFCVTLTASLYSKMLVGVNQGLWLGLLTTFGSLARVIGPLAVSSLYAEYGTYLIFGLITGSLVLAAILTLISFKKLKTV